MHFAFVPVVVDRKRNGWKLSAKEAITRADLQHIHEQMQEQLTHELGVPVNLLNVSMPLRNLKGVQLLRL